MEVEHAGYLSTLSLSSSREEVIEAYKRWLRDERPDLMAALQPSR
jgi:hypothetical protein